MIPELPPPTKRKAHPEHTIPSVELWSSTGSLKDGQLMSQRHVLEGDRHRPAEERPETDHKNHRHFLAGGISSE